MKIYFKNAYNLSEVLSLKNKADLIIVNYHKPMCFNMTSGIPSSVRAAREVCLMTGAEVLLHGKLDIEGDKYLSTMYLKNGEIAGVSDCITNDMYTQGAALRMYEIGREKSGISVDKDFMCSGTDNFFCAGAKIIYHNTLNKLNKEYFGAYKSHLRLSGGVYFGLFADCALVADGTVQILPDEGEFELKMASRTYANTRNFLKISKGE